MLKSPINHTPKEVADLIDIALKLIEMKMIQVKYSKKVLF